MAKKNDAKNINCKTSNQVLSGNIAGVGFEAVMF